MLPTVDFCGLQVTRLIIGANPFAGFSHQSAERNQEMLAYYTPGRIRETWDRALEAGINTMISNNETPHVVKTVEQYLREGGRLQWITQVSHRTYPSMEASVDAAVRIGARALYFHGGLVDDLYAARDTETLRRWVLHARSHGLPVGVAGHAPDAHRWVRDLDLVDFHAVCFFNCGSLHSGKGEKFHLADVPEAARCIREIEKPCIAYKIMGAGRIDALMAFEYAFQNIKDTDVVNVGMHRGDKDGMVEEDVRLACQALGI